MPMVHALLHRVRWRIFGLLFGFGCIAFLQQKGVTVAAAGMMPELGLSQMQIGWMESAFLIGYAAFQLPGGVIGQQLGGRRMFVLISLIAFLATVGVPLAPYALGGTVLFATFIALQFVLGAAQGAVFPVSSGIMESWFPARQWASIQGLQVMGLQFAAALTPPLIATLMSRLGWQQALLWPALPALGLIALWGWYARNTPAEHPAVTPAELAELDSDSGAGGPLGISWRRLGRLLSDRSIAMLTLSYTSMNYVFYLIGNWYFLYLIQVRHFTILEGGWLAAAPPLAAALGAGIGGRLSDVLCARFGVRWGYRLVPLVSLPAAGALLLVAVYAPNPYDSVIALALCFAALELNEGPYWAATMYVARRDTMSATGILNTGGNLGGVIGIPIVAYLSGHGAWTAAFVLGTVFALIATVAWMGVDATRRISD
ncbi:MAG: MFS transporter [Gammaproteobacteria bacterium]|nr:MFS transporter [Gammaproteobacteria bacterium]